MQKLVLIHSEVQCRTVLESVYEERTLVGYYTEPLLSIYDFDRTTTLMYYCTCISIEYGCFSLMKILKKSKQVLAVSFCVHILLPFWIPQVGNWTLSLCGPDFCPFVLWNKNPGRIYQEREELLRILKCLGTLTLNQSLGVTDWTCRRNLTKIPSMALANRTKELGAHSFVIP